MPALKIAILPVTPFAQNCSILVAEATGRAAIVDPGGEVARIRAAIDEMKVKPEKIFLTHGHIDHAGGAAELAEALSIPVEGPHEADRFLLDRLAESGAKFGMAGGRPGAPRPRRKARRQGRVRRAPARRAAGARPHAGARRIRACILEARHRRRYAVCGLGGA